MAKFIKLYNKNPNPRFVSQIVHCLQHNGTVICPTDTVYSLVCDINSNKALEYMAQLKGMKLSKTNFSFICEDLSSLSYYVQHIDSAKFKLLKRTLPGPYTYVLPGNYKLPSAFKKRKTIGLRIPDNNICKAIVAQLGNPIAATSIHDEDQIIEYTTDPELILEKWKNKVDIVIDGGFGDNIPSTVIDVTGDMPELIRKGKGSIDII